MRRRDTAHTLSTTNSNSNPSNNSNLQHRTNNHQSTLPATRTTLEMTNLNVNYNTSQTTARVTSSNPTFHHRHRRRTHAEMEKGSSFVTSSAATEIAEGASAIAAAAENVASSIDFDTICSSTRSKPKPNHRESSVGSSSESSSDEEKQPLMGKQSQRQSLLMQSMEQEQVYQLSQQHLLQSTQRLDIETIDFHKLPVDIQMALEDTLLGWTHLTSIAIGHVLLPLLVFYIVRWASKNVLETTVYTMSTETVTAGSETEAASEMSFEHEIEAVLVSPTTHSLLGIVAAIAAFRVIRHRRKVWFRHAYGSEAYKNCEEGRRRRAAVLETDRSKTSLLSLSNDNILNLEEAAQSPTWTSRVLKNYKNKRHKKKLQKASDRFERHHTGLTPPKTSEFRSRKHPSKLAWQNGYDETVSVAPTEEDCYDSSSSSSEDEIVDPKVSRNDASGVISNDGIAHDAVSIPRIHNVPYAHGGFFGAAPFFLADRRWVKILRALLPDVYVEISRRVGGGYFYGKRSDASKLIHWAENNPVVAAYGVVMDLQIKQELQASDSNAQSKPNSISNSNLQSKLAASFHGSNSSGNIIEQYYQTKDPGTPTKTNTKPIPAATPITPPTTNATNTNPDTPVGIKPNQQEQDQGQTIDIPNLEWDVFVDPQLVRRVEAVLKSMDRYVQSKLNAKTTPKATSNSGSFGGNYSSFAPAGSRQSPDRTRYDNCAFCKNENDNDNDNDDGIKEDVDDSGKSEATALLADQDDHDNSTMIINNLCGSTANICSDCFQETHTGGPSPSGKNQTHEFFRDEDGSNQASHQQQHDLRNDPVLRYLERELQKRTKELTDRLLIAHGNVLQLMMEYTGVLKDWNFSRIQRTRRTLGGGMYARQWMAVFAESLRLGMKPPRGRNRRKGRRDTTAKTASTRSTLESTDPNSHNFYDEEDDEDSLLLPLKQHQEPLHVDDDEEDSIHDNEESLEDEHIGSCSCSPRCCLDTTMVESLELIEQITRTKHPIGILLDLKSRHVPKRVLSLMVKALQASGIRVVGIASFEISDIRGVCSHHHQHSYQFGGYASLHHQCPSKIPRGIQLEATKEILMVHSAGDLQAACDDGLVRPGDHVFFNGGSLILDSARSSTIRVLLGFFVETFVCGYYNTFDPCAIEDGYKIQSYGYACNSMNVAADTAACFSASDPLGDCGAGHDHGPTRRKTVRGHGSVDNPVDDDHEREEDERLLKSSSSADTEMGAVMKTLADYKKHYGFSMGLYLQEFSIDEAAARLLIDLVNNHPKLYDLGLAWGGINGMTVHGIQPGRFTSTDGYWNQRRLGRDWKHPF